ncbi:MAG TPA: DNA-binding protein [Bacteroidales bacterium]|jgi:Response regulator containing a CheY-like receiver domain and an HTH DNA-binding domain
MNITFNELRRIKDNLPAGSVKMIADRLHLSEDTVRNYFGGSHYPTGESVGLHVEQGPDGGVVALDDTTILDMAISIIDEHAHSVN